MKHVLETLEERRAVARLGGGVPECVDELLPHAPDVVDVEVVAVGIVAEQREPEAVLAAGGSVATAGIASGLGEDGHDVLYETDWFLGFRSFDFHGNNSSVSRYYSK